MYNFFRLCYIDSKDILSYILTLNSVEYRNNKFDARNYYQKPYNIINNRPDNCKSHNIKQTK